MKNDQPNSLYDRFMHWAGGDDSTGEHELTEDPDIAEFREYIEYIDSHKFIDFEAYRKKHFQAFCICNNLDAEGGHHGHGVHVQEVNAPRRKGKKQEGDVKRAAGLYGVMSVLIALVIMAALVMVAVDLPAFGDPASPMINEVSERYLEKGIDETGAVNAVAGLILDYRAFDTFGESTVLFAASMCVILLMREGGEKRGRTARETDRILNMMGRLILPAVMMYGIYVVLNGHLSPGGGFSGGTVLGCGLILGALILGEERMEELLPPRRLTKMTVICLLSYGAMKGYSFFTGANHVGWEIPKGTPGDILSSGFILPLNICVGIIVACTMYTFYTLFVEKED